MIQLTINKIDFDIIEPIWRDELWPGRSSLIEPYSAMTFMNDSYNADFSRLPRVFVGGFVNGRLIAVNSVHLAEKYMARSRGLWVHPDFRSNGFGSRLLTESAAIASTLGADAIWSFPRKSSIRSYEDSGYTRVSSWMTHGEFGPNAYVIQRSATD